jgi:hypothetical protein
MMKPSVDLFCVSKKSRKTQNKFFPPRSRNCIPDETTRLSVQNKTIQDFYNTKLQSSKSKVHFFLFPWRGWEDVAVVCLVVSWLLAKAPRYTTIICCDIHHNLQEETRRCLCILNMAELLETL